MNVTDVSPAASQYTNPVQDAPSGAAPTEVHRPHHHHREADSVNSTQNPGSGSDSTASASNVSPILDAQA